MRPTGCSADPRGMFWDILGHSGANSQARAVADLGTGLAAVGVGGVGLHLQHGAGHGDVSWVWHGHTLG